MRAKEADPSLSRFFDNGVAIFIVNPKGLMLEASVGGQQFGYQALADAENIGE